MRREHFDHLIAAAAQVSGEKEIVVIGSQAILGTVDEPPESMALSMEADIYPRHDPAKAEEIDASLGDGSPFHGTHGYYAHGVGPETARAPTGWRWSESRSRLGSASRPESWLSASSLAISSWRSAPPAETVTGNSLAMLSRPASSTSMSSLGASTISQSTEPIASMCAR